MNKQNQSGYYVMEMAVLIPAALTLALSVADVMNILTAYSQLLEIAHTTLEEATSIAGESAPFTESERKPRYDWYKHTYNPNSGNTQKVHLGSSNTPPSECHVGGVVSCTAEFNNHYDDGDERTREIDRDKILSQIANDPVTRSVLGELAPTCNIQTDERCMVATIHRPGENGLGDEQVQLQLTANVPTIFLKYIYQPFFGQDFVQVSTTTTRVMETQFLQQSPLIMNNGFGADF